MEHHPVAAYISSFRKAGASSALAFSPGYGYDLKAKVESDDEGMDRSAPRVLLLS
jgi:hypothetical protein